TASRWASSGFGTTSIRRASSRRASSALPRASESASKAAAWSFLERGSDEGSEPNVAAPRLEDGRRGARLLMDDHLGHGPGMWRVAALRRDQLPAPLACARAEPALDSGAQYPEQHRCPTSS